MKTIIKLEGLARGSLEVRFLMEIRGCPQCGSRDFGEPRSNWYALVDSPGGEPRRAGHYDITCPACGHERQVCFVEAPGFGASKPTHHLGGPKPSTILEPHELVAELLYDFEHLRPAFAMVPVPAGWGELLENAENCVIELWKFLPEGADEIPAAYFRTEAAQAARAEHPERFRRAFLDEQQRELDKLIAAAEREVARRDAEGATAPQTPLPALVPPLTPASVKLHDAWLGDQAGGQRLHAIGTDATGKRLSAIDLTGAIFEDVVLDGADVSFTRLHAAKLTGVRARGAGFASAMLAGTTITRCDFTDAGMAIANLGDATIEDSTFAGANLERTTWYRSQVARTSFANAVMTDVGIDKAVFTDCDFRGADLGIVREGLLGTSMDATFVRCDLRDTNWDGRELFRVKLVDCKLAGARGRPRPERTEIERPDLSPAGDGSQIASAREVLVQWGIDPDAPPPGPPAPTHRELMYVVADDEGDYLEELLRGKGYDVAKKLVRRGTELAFELRTWEPIAAAPAAGSAGAETVAEPLAALIERQLARYRYAQQRRREFPEEYVNPDGTVKSAEQVFLEGVIEGALERDEPHDELIARLVGHGYTVEQAQQALIDPSKVRRVLRR